MVKLLAAAIDQRVSPGWTVWGTAAVAVPGVAVADVNAKAVIAATANAKVEREKRTLVPFRGNRRICLALGPDADAS